MLAGELIAAARPTHALEDAVANQRLQHRLQVSRRQPVPRGERLGGDRTPTRIDRDVDHGSDGKNAFARQ